MKRCILNVATDRYVALQERQAAALNAVGEKFERLYWTDRFPPDSPTHQQIPYAFKPFAFKSAVDIGFDYALWMDAAVWPIKPLDFYWELIEQAGHVLIQNGDWNTGQWCADSALKLLGITREESFTIPHLMANVIGLNLGNERSVRFLNQWLALTDAFRGAWNNRRGECSADPRVLGHRHDQTVASVVSHRLGMPWIREKDSGVLYYDGRSLDQLDGGVILLARG